MEADRRTVKLCIVKSSKINYRAPSSIIITGQYNIILQGSIIIYTEQNILQGTEQYNIFFFFFFLQSAVYNYYRAVYM